MRVLRTVAVPVLLLLALAGVNAGAALSAPAAPPAPAGYVTDKAGVLNSGAAAAMNSSLQGFDQQTGNQVVVWIDNDLPAGQTIDAFAQDAFNTWGIGQKDRNNGVLFVVFVRSHLTRIEVGTGLTAVLSGAGAANIINTQVLPRFRSGDYTGGVSAGLTGITGAVKGTAAAPIFPTVPSTPTSFHHGNALASIGFIAVFMAIVVFGLVWGRRRVRGYWGTNPYYYNHRGFSRGGFPSGSSGASGFSGGGFSGGGGSTGGGGATGSW